MGDVAIVTGGASGIGRALATALADRGGHVVIADRDADGGAQAAAAITNDTTGSAEARTVDVTDADAVAHLVRDVHREHGRLDVLCNNVGIGLSVPAEHLRLEDYTRTLDVNLRGVVHGCVAAVPLMVAAGRGRILNTSSGAGLIGGGGSGAPYSTSKFGIVGLSLALHTGLAQHGVRVSVLCPGGVDTPLLDRRSFPELQPPDGVDVRTARETMSLMRMRAVPPDRVARYALRKLDRGAPIIVTPASMRFAWRMYRLAPRTMLRIAAKTEGWLSRR